MKDIYLDKCNKNTSNIINNTINNTTNNIDNSVNNNIIINNYKIDIVPFGEENINYINEKLEKYITRPKKCYKEIIRNWFFSIEHPENRNVDISNKSQPYAMYIEKIKDGTRILKFNKI